MPGYGYDIINAGFPGDNTRQLLERFEADVAAHAPDCVILMCGTNDLLNSHNLLSEEEYEKNLKELILRIRSAGAAVILCGTPDANQSLMIPRHTPGFFEEKSARERVSAANAVSQRLAEQMDILRIDTQKVLGEATCAAESLFRNEANSGTPDGVHPTPQGYAALAAAIAAELKKRPVMPERIVCFGDSITYGVHVRGEGTADPDAENYPGQLARLLNEGRTS